MSCPILTESGNAFLLEDGGEIEMEACGAVVDDTAEWVFEIRVRAPSIRSVNISPVVVTPGRLNGDM